MLQLSDFSNLKAGPFNNTYVMNLCGKDRPEKTPYDSVVNISSRIVERTHKGRHCKGRIKIA